VYFVFLGYLDEAREMAEALTKNDPLYPSGHGYLGSIHFAQGNAEAAIVNGKLQRIWGFRGFPSTCRISTSGKARVISGFRESSRICDTTTRIVAAFWKSP
jgi:hypothetical protein